MRGGQTHRVERLCARRLLPAGALIANGSRGSTILLGAGTLYLTIQGPPNTLSTDATTVDLDILAATSIIGPGAGSTIVQAGTTSFTGIEG